MYIINHFTHNVNKCLSSQSNLKGMIQFKNKNIIEISPMNINVYIPNIFSFTIETKS